jgi:hypothetical protein
MMFEKFRKLRLPARIIFVIDIIFPMSLVLAWCHELLFKGGDFLFGIIFIVAGLWTVFKEVQLNPLPFEIISLYYIFLALAVGIDLWVPSPENSWYFTPALGTFIITLLLLLAAGSVYVADAFFSSVAEDK